MCNIVALYLHERRKQATPRVSLATRNQRRRRSAEVQMVRLVGHSTTQIAQLQLAKHTNCHPVQRRDDSEGAAGRDFLQRTLEDKVSVHDEMLRRESCAICSVCDSADVTPRVQRCRACCNSLLAVWSTRPEPASTVPPGHLIRRLLWPETVSDRFG